MKKKPTKRRVKKIKGKAKRKPTRHTVKSLAIWIRSLNTEYRRRLAHLQADYDELIQRFSDAQIREGNRSSIIHGLQTALADARGPIDEANKLVERVEYTVASMRSIESRARGSILFLINLKNAVQALQDDDQDNQNETA